MRARLELVALYYVAWLAFFVLARVIFLLYHASLSASLDASTLAGTVIHGFRMDLAAAAYPSAVIALLMGVSTMMAPRITRWLAATMSVAALVLASLITIIDLEVYAGWGFRLDSTPLRYLASPNETIAGAGSANVAIPLFILAALLALGLFVLFRVLLARIGAFPRTNPLVSLPLLLAAGLLLIPARGGLQLWPLNQSTVYFSRVPFANHAAINVTWNFFSSLQRKPYERDNPYRYMSTTEARHVVDSLRPPVTAGHTSLELLNTKRPNVVVIIWESLTAKVVAPLGGTDGVTPELAALAKEGIFFADVYASGDRTDRGLAAILSAVPAHGRTAIINEPARTTELPVLSHDFEKAGYFSAFYYGGELDFVNLRAYLIHGGFGRIVGETDFAESDAKSRWGAHDHVVLGKLLRESAGFPQPFFATVLTLSSHEPYSVPDTAAFSGSEEEKGFLNAHHYTDRSIGEFVRAAKSQPWWGSALVVIIADHGHRLPASTTGMWNALPSTFRIPMLWLGGALAKRDTVIERIGSQTDFAATLLGQLGMSASRYPWSSDMLADGARPFAYYAFNDGFGVVSARGRIAFDNVAKRAVYQDGTAGAGEIRAGQAVLQLSFQEYLARGNRESVVGRR